MLRINYKLSMAYEFFYRKLVVLLLTISVITYQALPVFELSVVGFYLALFGIYCNYSGY